MSRRASQQKKKMQVLTSICTCLLRAAQPCFADLGAHIDGDAYPSKINQVEFSRDGRFLMSCSYTAASQCAQIILWSVGDGRGPVFMDREVDTGKMPISSGGSSPSLPQCGSLTLPPLSRSVVP